MKEILAVSIFMRKEERCKNNDVGFYLKEWEIIQIFGSNRKFPKSFLWNLYNCETKPDNDNSGKEKNFSFRSETLMIQMQISIEIIAK